jgi:hypothetical protein
MREVTRQTLSTWLNMCQHPEKYCDSCGKLKKFCSCEQSQQTPKKKCLEIYRNKEGGQEE